MSHGSRALPPRRWLVLVVEDDRDILEGLSELLREEDFDVVSASSGREALAHLDDGVRPDLTLLDWWLGDVPGREFLRRRGEVGGAGPVFVISGDRHTEEEVRWSRSLGVVRHISKPFDPERLLQQVIGELGGGARTPSGSLLLPELDMVGAGPAPVPTTPPLGPSGGGDPGAELVETDGAVRAREELLAMVAHDLRSPLTRASLAARSLLAEDPPPDRARVRERARQIEDSVRLMERLVQDLLDFSQMEAGRFQVRLRPERLVPTLFRAVAEARSVAPCAVELSVPGRLREARARLDAQRLDQVLTNLLANAIRFTPRDGSIEVMLEKADGRLRVIVNDDGPGVAPMDRERIFRLYERGGIRQLDEDEESTLGRGLGLHVARGIIESHGGEIGVDEAQGGGSAFWFTLPAIVEG